MLTDDKVAEIFVMVRLILQNLNHYKSPHYIRLLLQKVNNKMR